VLRVAARDAGCRLVTVLCCIGAACVRPCARGALLLLYNKGIEQRQACSQGPDRANRQAAQGLSGCALFFQAGPSPSRAPPQRAAMGWRAGPHRASGPARRRRSPAGSSASAARRGRRHPPWPAQRGTPYPGAVRQLCSAGAPAPACSAPGCMARRACWQQLKAGSRPYPSPGHGRACRRACSSAPGVRRLCRIASVSLKPGPSGAQFRSMCGCDRCWYRTCARQRPVVASWLPRQHRYIISSHSIPQYDLG